MLERYAQQIVQEIAEIIDYEVLMTNREGIIIGSSDPDRIGKPLVEAPLVIRTRKPCIIDEEGSRQLPHAVKGVTYPIDDFTGEVIGSIAITGNPEEVKPFALIVKEHAELFIRERLSISSLFEKERTLQNFLRELEAFDPRESDITLLEAKARNFGYRPTSSYSVIRIRISNFPSMMRQAAERKGSEKPERELVLQSLRNRVTLEIKQLFSRPGDICAPFGSDDFVVLHALDNMDNIWQELKRKVSLLLERLRDSGFQAETAIGPLARDPEALSRSFKYAGEVMEKGKSMDPGGRIFSVEDLRFEILLSSTRPEYRDNFLSVKLDRLKNQRDWEGIRETILAWCETDFSIKDAAEKLHIHRNTLKYRLEKIENLCSIELRNFRSLLELYTAIILDRLKS